MKKIFSIIMIACMIAAITSCKGNTKGSNSDSISEKTESATSKGEDRTFTAEEDSIALDMGEMLGASLKAQLDMDPSYRKNIDMEQFKKGFEMILKCDSSKTDQSFLQGAVYALKLYENIAMTESQGININHDKLVGAIFKMIDSKDSIDVVEINKKGQKLQSKLMKMTQAKADANKAAGEKYIKEKIQTDSSYLKTPSGAYYKVLKAGEGANFKDKDVIDIVFVSKHVNGKEYYSTNGKPEENKMDMIPPGLKDVIKLMKPGAKFIAVIPSNLAYGGQGVGPIQPNETLIFEINSVNIHH